VLSPQSAYYLVLQLVLLVLVVVLLVVVLLELRESGLNGRQTCLAHNLLIT